MNETQPDATPPACPNCGDPRPGNFCPNCGQRRGDRRVTLRRLIADAVEDQFSLNGTLPRTLGVLLTHPGRLTSDYVAGRISRYIPPFRLYLLSSFLFFLVLSISGSGNLAVTRSDDDAPADSAGVLQDTAAARARAERAAAARDTMVAAIDSVLDDDAGDLEFLPGPLRERARERLRIMATREEGAVNEAFRREMMDRLPIAVFVLLPVFAGLLALIYVRSRRFYVEHFIFALHIHSFGFLMFTLMQLLDRWAWLELILLIWLLVYLFLALRHFYRQGILKTMAKFLFLNFIYGILLFFSGLVILLIVLLTAPL